MKLHVKAERRIAGTKVFLEADQVGANRQLPGGLRGCAGWFLHVAILFTLAAALPTQAQIIQTWTHQAVFGEASAVVGMDQDSMFVADNEDELLRLYQRAPANNCALPVYTFDVRPFLNLSSTKPEADLEAAVRLDDENGTRICWLGSHSNSKSGNLRPNRYRLFATQVSGDGSGAEPYSLAYLGRYDHLRTDLLVWDQNNLHGLGANYFGLTASAAQGVIPKRIDGFNIEGLSVAPDGQTAYIAFRAPLVNAAGPTTSSSERTHALIVPLFNMSELVAGNPTSGPGAAAFGAPITLDLGGRGVRSIDSSHPGQYLITAGPPAETSFPPTAPNDFRLFTWSGEVAEQPVECSTQFPAGYSPEAAIVSPGPISPDTVVQFVSDDSGGCWRSFTTLAGVIDDEPPSLVQLSAAQGRGFVLNDGSVAGSDYVVEMSTNLVDWLPLLTLRQPVLPVTWLDPDQADMAVRFYRVYRQK